MEASPEPRVVSQSAAREERAVGGKLRLHEFSSRVFRNTRFLRVWVPEEYDRPENAGRPYPVFYLNDGQNLFESATSFTGVEWRVGATADLLVRSGLVPPVIFVGIDNAGLERIKEYTPYRSLNPAVLSPRGQRFPEFVIREVMPFVGQRYRVAKGADHTSLGGSSLGGLISLYTLMAAPGVFGRALLESPSLWVAKRRILKESRSVRVWPERVFLAVGTHEVGRENKDREAVENVRELERIMRASGLDERRLRVEIQEGATHNEGAWAARFPDAMRFLFG